MWRFLVGLGLLLAVAGLVVVALGVAIFVSSLGNALIAAGAACLVGGGTLAAVGLVLKELNDISSRLDALLAGSIGVPAAGETHYYNDATEEEYEEEPVAPAAPAIPEPLAAPRARDLAAPSFPRSSFERPPAQPAAPVIPEFDFNLPEPEPEDEPAPAPVAPAPIVPPLPEPTSRLPEALQRGRVLGRISENAPFPPRPRPEPAPAPEQDAPAERLPERSLFGTRPFTPPNRRPDPASAASQPPAPPPAPPAAAPAPYAPPTFSPGPTFTPPTPPPPPAPPASEPSVLKSGVVGGMAYTLYSDGSIQAELPDGTLRFASLQELRDHVARSGKPN